MTSHDEQHERDARRAEIAKAIDDEQRRRAAQRHSEYLRRDSHREEVVKFVVLGIAAVIAVLLVIAYALGDRDDSDVSGSQRESGCFYLHWMANQVRFAYDEWLETEIPTGPVPGASQLKLITPPSELTDADSDAAKAFLGELIERRTDAITALEGDADSRPREIVLPSERFGPFFRGAGVTWQGYDCTEATGRHLYE